jgi:hypothetical protein
VFGLCSHGSSGTELELEIDLDEANDSSCFFRKKISLRTVASSWSCVCENFDDDPRGVAMLRRALDCARTTFQMPPRTQRIRKTADATHGSLGFMASFDAPARF